MLPVRRLCQITDVGPRGYRAFCARPLSACQLKDWVILPQIREPCALFLGSYGRSGMAEELKEVGVDVGYRRSSREAIAKRSAERGTAIRRSTSHRTVLMSISLRTGQSSNGQAPLGTFSAEIHCRAMDISYVWTRDGWLYLAVIIDPCSRRVVGWAVSNRMTRDLAIRALEMAVNLRKPPEGCINHTGRGSQYYSHDDQKILRKNGFKASIPPKFK